MDMEVPLPLADLESELKESLRTLKENGQRSWPENRRFYR
jgi:hypothetical protein